MFRTIHMAVSKLNKQTEKREEVGKVDIYVPDLAEFGLDYKQSVKDGKPEESEEGLPIYADDKANFLQEAIYASVKANARNKLEAGTATVKAGLSIPTNFDELLAETVRSGAGLALYQEVKAKFNAWVSGLQKSAAAKQTISMLFGNKNALLAQNKDNKTKMEGYITEFAATLSVDDLAKYTNSLDAVLAICSQDLDANDF